MALALLWSGAGAAPLGAGTPCAAAAESTPAAADAPAATAGLVVEMPDGSVMQRCVSLVGDRISGLDLLRSAGFRVVYEDHGGGRVTICSIEGQGCAYPGKPCFCRCRDVGAGCRFWGFYRLESARWVFSELGAGEALARPGEVHGWKWGEHGGKGNPPAGDASGVCSGRPTVAAPAPAGAAGTGGGPSAVMLTAFGAAVAGLALWAALAARARRRRPEGEGP